LLPGSYYAVFVEESSKQRASLIIHVLLGGGGGKSVLAVFSILLHTHTAILLVAV